MDVIIYQVQRAAVLQKLYCYGEISRKRCLEKLLFFNEWNGITFHAPEELMLIFFYEA